MKNEYGLEVVNVRLIKEKSLYSDSPVGNPRDAERIVADEMATWDREVFCVMNLNTKGKVINLSVVSVGVLDSSMVHPREVFKSVILSNAAGVILIHNHPSGVPEPSPEDFDVTKRLMEAGDVLGIKVVDHLIVAGGTGEYYSLASEGDLENIREELERERYRDFER